MSKYSIYYPVLLLSRSLPRQDGRQKRGSSNANDHLPGIPLILHVLIIVMDVDGASRKAQQNPKICESKGHCLGVFVQRLELTKQRLLDPLPRSNSDCVAQCARENCEAGGQHLLSNSKRDECWQWLNILTTPEPYRNAAGSVSERWRKILTWWRPMRTPERTKIARRMTYDP